MASSSGTSSGSSSLIQNSGSEEDLQALMDQRKRKRMISNRESARRSRMRKQKHLDDLTVQVAQLTKENHQIVTSVNITTQHYLNIEAENSILRAQVGELSHRLQSLDEIISFLNASNAVVLGTNNNHSSSDSMSGNCFTTAEPIESFFNRLNQPIMASAHAFQY
ncbi:Basic-leucine zipper transcription factor [Parasponia andersonii]|uniref:Basic-leucine zipper transcription factor n=1 Tax=Parasponia andersonii TaxID=3476 RepID=A0A2P5CVQ4_PARAD|nr:Basic-leucine zipper transcription factor [Parasponia andersonii]